MTGHDLWHIAVLGSTLFAAAGLAVVALASLMSDEMPAGVQRGRPVVAALVAVTAALIIVEWLGIH